jgi:hypothetical protein
MHNVILFSSGNMLIYSTRRTGFLLAISLKAVDLQAFFMGGLLFFMMKTQKGIL